MGGAATALLMQEDCGCNFIKVTSTKTYGALAVDLAVASGLFGTMEYIAVEDIANKNAERRSSADG